jgi:hypothetical protein
VNPIERVGGERIQPPEPPPRVKRRPQDHAEDERRRRERRGGEPSPAPEEPGEPGHLDVRV